jgi:hypothetical protein
MMQPTLIDIEHGRAVWAERSRGARQPAAPALSGRARVADLLARAAARIDSRSAHAALAPGPAVGRRP